MNLLLAHFDPFHRHWVKHRLLLIQGGQTVRRNVRNGLGALEVGFNVEMRVTVLLIQPAALFDDFVDLLLAGLGSLFVRSNGILTQNRALERMDCRLLGVEVVWEGQ